MMLVSGCNLKTIFDEVMEFIVFENFPLSSTLHASFTLGV